MTMDDKGTMVPIVLFVCATIAFKALLETVIRLRLMHLHENGSVLQGVIEADRRERRLGSLRNGIALVAAATGAAFVETLGWRDLTAGAIAAVLAPLGLGELLFYFL